MGVRGVRVCAGVRRDGGRAGCGFSAVGIRVQAGKAGGKYEGNSNGNLRVTVEISLSL